ncbi:LPXTG cell wall anchor domain-containing protein [Glycomyces sp. NPDC047010]|uniref:LPXTG cell wall anchor domain-containing protein n=1 Tax=Glycomyces sp. NPDC047010 TaxID=3155023 RepID=UPI0033CE9376
MSPVKTAARASAALAAAALGAGAFALPAQAQTFTPTEVFVEDYSPIAFGDEPGKFGLRIAFGDDFAAGEHDVTAVVELDTLDNAFTIGLPDGTGSDCPVNDTATTVSCTSEDADAVSFWEFRYAPTAELVSGEYDYTVTFAVDGETVAVREDTIEVVGTDDDAPYLHGIADYTGVAPGSSVAVEAEVLQQVALPADTAAVVAVLTGPDFAVIEGVEVTAGYDNCTEGAFGGPGATCVITDFPDEPGTAFALSPVDYALDAGLPGPYWYCDCEYEVFPVDEDGLAGYGGVTWDEGSENLMGLTASDGPDEYSNPFTGYINVQSGAQQYDLSVANANAKGAKDTETTVTVSATNAGPADAVRFFDETGSYAVLGALPAGLELVAIDDEDVTCPDAAEWADLLPLEDLSGLDFACFFDALPAGETLELDVRVKVTGDASANDGTLAVVARQYEEDGFEADPADNDAVFSVNAGGSPNLPTTGSSMTVLLGGAGAVLAAGTGLAFAARKRRITTAA